MKWDRQKVICDAAALASIKPPHSPIQRASLQAARLIEAAMYACGRDDLKALECLLEARRALSPMVDRRTPPPPASRKPDTETPDAD